MENLQPDVESVSRIEAVPTILEVVCRTTGMRFAAVARVTEARWVAGSVLDQIDFGLNPGAVPGACFERRRRFRTIRCQRRGTDPGGRPAERRFQPSYRGAVRQDQEGWVRALYLARNRGGARRDAPGYVDGRGNPLYVPHAGDVIAGEIEADIIGL